MAQFSPIKTLKSLTKESFSVYWALLKIMVPALIIVKILDSFGGTQLLANLLSPLMSLVGLPDSFGIVWATAILTNIYTGMVVFYEVSNGQNFSVAEISVLCSMMLVAHSIPIEGAVAKAVGISWRFTLLLRIGGGLLLGFLVMHAYQWGDWQQQTAVLAWQPELQATTLSEWAIEQLQITLSIFFIIFALISFLRMLRFLGIEKLLHWLLTPLLNLLTMSKSASNVTIIGMTLGLSFGGGLLINEVKQGKINKRDTLLAISLLGLCHSLIEDTLLMLLLGADINSILWGRLFFGLAVIAVMARLINKSSRFSGQLTDTT